MSRQLAEWITHRSLKWVALAVMLVMTVGLGTLSSKVEDIQQNEYENWLPADAESTLAIREAARFTDTNSVPLVMLYERAGGIERVDFAAAESDIAALVEVSGVDEKVIGPIESPDGEALQSIVTIHLDPADGWNKFPDTFDAITRAIETSEVPDGLKVYYAGPAAFVDAQSSAFTTLDAQLFLVALAIVILVLLIAYRSPTLILPPLLCGVLSAGAANGVIYLLGKHTELTVTAQSGFLLNVLVLGASIDYALLLVARYREELHHYADRHEAMAHALHRAAPAIVASGLTVALGMLCLAIADMNSTASLGPVLAAGILVALLVMLVLFPVLLVVLGRWIFWPFIPKVGTPDKQASGFWAKFGALIAKAPRAVWMTTTGVLIVLGLGIVKLDATGLSNDEQFIEEPPYVHATEVLGSHFPAGGGSPLQVIANAGKAKDVIVALKEVEGVDPASVKQLAEVDGRGYIEATHTAPSGSVDAVNTVDRAREAVHDVDGADALVGGETAIIDDTQSAAQRDNWVVIPLVLLVVLVILGVLLRSILAPVLLLTTVVLSFGAAIGISALLFHYVFDFPGADSGFPLFAFVFLVALGVDYNIFLMTRVREESLEHGTRRASLIALAATGSVITSAGLVLAGTFTALATLPLVFAAEIGIAVALGVLLDTFIVRSVLVTALNPRHRPPHLVALETDQGRRRSDRCWLTKSPRDGSIRTSGRWDWGSWWRERSISPTSTDPRSEWGRRE